MKKSLLLCAIATASITPSLRAQVRSTPIIQVSTTGRVAAKADLAIVFMVLRSSAPLAAYAVSQNMKKAQDIETRLAALGLREKSKLSGNRVASASGPYYGGPRPTTWGFEASEYVYVFFEGPELDDIRRLEARAGEIIDDLSRLGASPVDTPVAKLSQQVPFALAFTIKDPSHHLKAAREQAIEKARAAGEDIARAMGVKITGTMDIRTGEQIFYSTVGASPFDDLPYDFFSASKDVPVSVSLSVDFGFR